MFFSFGMIAMHIHIAAKQNFETTIEKAWDLSTDLSQFSSFFPGYLLIPAVKDIELLYQEPHVGGKRLVHNADGTTLEEEILIFAPYEKHSYSLYGFVFPFSWLVSLGKGTWTYEKKADQTLVTWKYDFTVRSLLLAPLTHILLHLFMQKAMAQCLRNMARSFHEANVD